MTPFLRRSKAENSSAEPVPPPQLVVQARTVPGGWVYEIVGDYQPDDAVPPEAIKGAWKVDAHGRLTGEYTANARYQPPQNR